MYIMYLYVHMYMYASMYACMHVCMYVCMCICVCMNACVLCVHVVCACASMHNMHMVCVLNYGLLTLDL